MHIRLERCKQPCPVSIPVGPTGTPKLAEKTESLEKSSLHATLGPSVRCLSAWSFDKFSVRCGAILAKLDSSPFKMSETMERFHFSNTSWGLESSDGIRRLRCSLQAPCANDMTYVMNVFCQKLAFRYLQGDPCVAYM